MHLGRPAPIPVRLAVSCLAFALPWARRGAAPPADSNPARLRRPVDAAFLPDGTTLCVANQRSGTVSLVDVPGRRVVAELAVGGRPSAVAALPERRQVLLADEERHQLIVLGQEGHRLVIHRRLAVSPYPVSIAVAPDGTHATIASLWSQRLDVVDLLSLRVLHSTRLPFAPRNQAVLPGGHVAVADSFSGRLAVVSVPAGRLIASHELAGHNIRGLALSADGKRLLAAHQVLDQTMPTTRENVRRGLLMGNVLRSIPLDALMTPRADLHRSSRVTPLGAVGSGAGDPAGIAAMGAGRVAVALAGVSEVAFLAPDGPALKRVRVGRRPTVLIPSPNADSLVAVNTFDDSLSVLDPTRGVVAATLPLGRRPDLGYRDRGEQLFYDARLSPDGWMSCHSCHSDGHTNGLLADTRGDGSFGAPKRTLTLLGTGLTDPWGWDGKEKYLHDQVRKSLAETMHTPSLTEEHVGDLTTFLNALPPAPPLQPAAKDPADRERVDNGRRLFEEKGCVRCHIAPLTYSSGGAYDVGFADERGLKAFNPPSLRGVSQGSRFLHDNRAASLEEVFTKHRHKVGTTTPGPDIDDLVRFLRSL